MQKSIRNLMAWLLGAALVQWGAASGIAGSPASKADLNRIINGSANFLKNREPEMTGIEYALYEKVVAMIEVQPDFAMQLLEGMMSGKDRPSPAFEFVLGNAYYTSGRCDLAEAYYRRAIEQYPDYQRAWCNLGVLYYAAQRYDQAARCIGRAVALGDGTPETLGLLAYSYQREGNPVAAEMAYLRGVSVAPEKPDLIEGLFSLYVDQKQYGRADALGRQLLRVCPKESRYWMQYAALLVAQERKIDAITVLESARSLQLAGDEMLLLLGDLCAQQKLFPEAIVAYTAVSKEKTALGVARLLGFARALVEDGQLKSAETLMGSLESSIPDALRGEFLQARADVRAAKKDWAGARQDLDAVLASQPLNGAAWLQLGQVMRAAQQPIAAQQALAAAAQRPETAYRAHLELADLALEDRRFPECIDHLEQALSIEKSPVIQDYLTKIKAIAPKQ
jgi:tetratricopeptide (TPR) repeat protein